MRILCIDTSTPLASVAVAHEDKLLAESLFPADRCLSARLIPEIERLLALAGLTLEEIDLFAAAVGPGSFTGVRAGVATIQGLALARGKHCVGFSTLAMLALGLPHAQSPVCPLLDARKSEVYGALYDCSAALPSTLIADCVISPALLLEQIATVTDSPIIFLGEGAVRYREMIFATMGDRALFAPTAHHAGRASNGLPLVVEALQTGCTVSPAELLPVYIRPSEAELARKTAH